MKRLNFLLSSLMVTAFSMLIPAMSLAHGISEADKQAMLNGGYVKYMWLGATHMLTGYDHLLFIFGVIFFLTTFKDIVKFISVFTVGHCITLIFATFFKITANYYIIDAIIAVSVMYKGFENINGFKKVFDWEPPSLLKMVFLFGLLHGFGLSTRLQQLPLGDDNVGMLFRILSFNVGVEVGQIAALVAMMVFLSGFRKAAGWAKFAYAANISLIAGGIFLFFMQFHGYWHQTSSDEFPLNQDDHSHIHLDMKTEELESFQ
ncbi:MAG: HupE/UreJ family protein [Bdellovibrionales bacterium]|nr:HupE/UreJ family protein [Bdellovibrionales bacterium]